MFYVSFKKEQRDAFFYPKSNSPFESLHKLNKFVLPTQLGEGYLFRVQGPYLMSPWLCKPLKV